MVSLPSPSNTGARRDNEDARLIVAHLQRSEIFQLYQQAFGAATGLPLVLRGPGSFQPPLHGAKRSNPFCELMAQRNRSCAACLQFQQRVENAATQGAKTSECYAGLSESVVPVRVGERVVAYLQTGQIFLQPPTKERFKQVMAELEVSGTAVEMREIELAYFRTRVVTRNVYDSTIRLLGLFAQHLAIVSNRLIVAAAEADLPAIMKARAFITEHQTEDIRLIDVAHAANMSAFYFCKLFRRATGCTFTTYLARLRIETVKQMLGENNTRVCEAAYAAGFKSLSQFNRVFRRIAGESPSHFRRRQRFDPQALVRSQRSRRPASSGVM